MNHTNIQRRPGFQRIVYALMILLIGTIIAPLTRAHDAVWSFKLKKTVTETAPGEIIVMSGGGTFDPANGTVAASGTYLISNMVDEGSNPSDTMAGSWTATSFDVFRSSHGRIVLQLTITMIFDGEPATDIKLTIIDDAVLLTGANLGDEDQFLIPAGGKTEFEIKKGRNH